jgi:hypothetical protein
MRPEIPEHLRAFFESPAWEFLRSSQGDVLRAVAEQQVRVADLLGPARLSVLGAGQSILTQQAEAAARIAELSAPYREVASIVARIASESMRPFREIVAQQEAMRSAQQGALRAVLSAGAIPTMMRSPAFNTLGSVQESIREALGPLSREVDGLVRRISEGTTFDADAIVDRIEDAVQTIAAGRETSTVTREGILALLMLVLALLQVYAGFQGDTSTHAKLDKLIEVIQQQATPLAAPTPGLRSPTMYVVARNLNLRSRPTTRASIITVLRPNQRVELVQRKREWVYVEYFDYVEDVPKTGWVAKKYLKRIRVRSPRPRRRPAE